MALSNWSTEQYDQNNTPLNNIWHSRMITVMPLDKASRYYQLISMCLECDRLRMAVESPNLTADQAC